MKNLFIRLLALVLILSAPSLIAQKKPKMAKAKPAGDKPSISRIEPRGIQNGIETKIKIIGTNLIELTELNFSHTNLIGEILETDETNATEVWIKITASPELTRGGYDLWLKNGQGESGKVKIYLDDLPHVYEEDTNRSSRDPKIPVVFWGALDPMADKDEWEFQAKSGQNLVIDCAAKSIGSKANLMVGLFDDTGKLLADDTGFDGGDPLLFHKVSKSGTYKVRISEKMMGGSFEHFYSVSIGEFPKVIGFFPLSVRTNAEARVQLVGYNLPAESTVTFKANNAGEMELPIDSKKFRSRKAFKVLVTDGIESVEAEPNHSPANATKIEIPGAIGGRIASAGKGAATDEDLFQFDAKAGQQLVFETLAARRGSPIDTKIEILHADGKPVERLLLQSVRDSWINFRPIDAASPDIRVENWEEMELNQFMYLQGEVNRIFRMPEGPDSGFRFYSSGGKRYSYFDTSPMAHALDEPCYVVEPHSPGAKLVPNGLPVFTIYYANDDDGQRKLDSDSRIQFIAPKDGTYLVRVSDNLGRSGDRFAYRLSAREAKPDFNVTLNGANPTVPPGSGQEFSFTVDRIDGFDGDVKIEIAGMPSGFLASTPIVIQAGHFTANGTIFAAADAKDPGAAPLETKITATATVDGKEIVKVMNNFEKVKLGEQPKLVVSVEPYVETETNFVMRSISDTPQEITIAPGQTVPVWLKVKRSGHDDLVTFTVENLPHGVIVDNIGLSGVLIPKGESERQIFLKAAKWVPETDRLAYCQAKQAGNPTSLPVLIKVRKSAAHKVAASEIR